MTTQFYSRYIPTATINSPVDQKSVLAERLQKRKRTSNQDIPNNEDADTAKRKKRNSDVKDEDKHLAKEEKKEKRRKKKESKEQKSVDDDTPQLTLEDPAIEVHSSTKPKKKDKPKSKASSEDTKIAPEPKDSKTGHATILEKLRRSLNRAADQPPPPVDTASPESETPVITKGLEPLPQPEVIKPSKPVSTLRSLPSWLSKPISVSPTATVPFSSISGLSPKLQQKLSSQSFNDAFAVQSAVLPLLLHAGEGDVCVAAATGSGKTLSYVLPVIQSLSSRVVTRLRAIIVVPTRELVSQVNAVTNSLLTGTGLKTGTAVGSRPLVTEQGMLVSNEDGEFSSKIDILITTPGRLVEHIRSTPGFSLKWVRWLVIDEADRLLAQSFQEWVDVVIGGLEKAAIDKPGEIAGVDLGDFGIRKRRSEEALRKVVLSATMTRDIGKLSILKLKQPKLVVVEDAKPTKKSQTEDQVEDAKNGDQFSVPPGLNEHAVPVENIELKPLCLLYLLRMRDIKAGALVFVKSNEAAARLAKLIATVASDSWRVELVSGEMEKKRREKVLRRFRKGDIDLLICSDLISRGMDMPNVEHIINYDIPASTRAYVHRVGRTARAGKQGNAWTLLGDKEARWFWNAIGREIRRSKPIEKIAVEMEAEGMGLRGVYEGVLYGDG